MVILDGPDGLGKTTYAKLLCERYRYKYYNQPSENNALGFIRTALKSNTLDINVLERQLLHTCSHLVDYMLNWELHDSFIIDRCYLSTLVYSELMGIPESMIELMRKINYEVIKKTIHTQNIKILILDRSERYNKPSMETYESYDWNKLRQLYLNRAKKIWNGETLFNERERVHIVELGEGSIEENLSKMVDIVG